MTDKIKKAEYLDRLERKKRVLGIGVDLTKDLEHLVNLEKKAKKSNDVKDIEKLKKQLTLVKNDIDNRLLQQEKNIKQVVILNYIQTTTLLFMVIFLVQSQEKSELKNLKRKTQN